MHYQATGNNPYWAHCERSPNELNEIDLSQSLYLPSGAVLGNWFAKAAMSEGMADANNDAASSTVPWT
jgi:hypothetical protein